MELFLKLVNGETIEQSVDADICVIGRSAKCDVVVPHEGMSRQHCQIEVVNGEVFITDLGSTNGVLIDGHKIEPHVKTPYQTYLALSFGAVQSLQMNLEGGTLGRDSSQTDNTTQHRANFTRTVTRTMENSKTSPNAGEATRVLRGQPQKEGANKIQMWAMNILALLILAGAVYWYVSNEDTSSDMPEESAPVENTKPEENFDRF